jgi:hypothetical protein
MHQPPPVHQTFQGDGFVVCSFVPRLYDYHPQAIPAPYNHSNVMSDEVLYYCNDEFMSRRASSTARSRCIRRLPHGPQPGRRGVDRQEGDRRAGRDGRHLPSAPGRGRGSSGGRHDLRRLLAGVNPMDAALRELLTGLFDYAGLFPPASLAASDAVRTYADAREGDERWMLGRFVFPLQRRHEVVAGVDSLGEDFGPLAITGLLRGNAVEEDLAGFGGEVERDSLRVEAFEVRVPEPVAGTGSGRVAGWVEGVAGTLVDEGYSGIPLWIETGWGADGRARTEAAIRGLSALRTTRMPVGLKLRCGGATSADFPTSAMLAAAVVHCARPRSRSRRRRGCTTPCRARTRRSAPACTAS